MKTITRTKRWLIALVMILAAGALALGGLLYAQGFWDEEKAVHITADTIEPSTLAIGTHLIHLSALTDSIYEIANQSAEESGQNTIYYKSELGGGAWFDITSATSLADITEQGTAVQSGDIEALFFTHHTKSDKVTYDLRTGRAVNIFNIRDPYELETLDELSPLKMYYDQVIEMEGENDITERIDEIWQTPMTGDAILEKEKNAAEALKDAMAGLLDQIAGLLRPEQPEVEKQPETTQVERMDAQLAALQRYLDVLTGYNAEITQIEKVSGVMAAVDAGRRYQVFVFVEEALNEYMDELSGDTEGEVPAELLSALAESIGNVQDALITYGGKMLDEGMTVISNVEYEFSNDLIRHAEADNHAACDGDVKNLLLLGNLQSSVVAERGAELALLDEKLLPKAEQIYQLVLSAGESAEYKAAVAKNSAQAMLNSLLEAFKSEISTRRGELEFLIEAKCSRMDTVGAQDYIRRAQEQVSEKYTVRIPKDDFQTAGLDSVAAHIEFLSQKQRELERALGGNEMDKLQAEKEALQTQRLQALDQNDLAGAKALEEQINGIEEEIRAIEAEQAARIAQLQESINALEPGSAERTDLEAELANLQNSFSDGSMAGRVSDLKKEVLDALSGGSGGDGENDPAAGLDALTGLLGTAPELVLPALQEIYNNLLLNGGDQDLIDAIEQAIVDNPYAMRDDMSAEQVKAAAKAWLLDKNEGAGESAPLFGAGGLSRMNDEMTLAAIAGMQMYHDQTGDKGVLQVMTALAQELKNLGNPLVFDAIVDGSGEYLPLTAVQALTGRRYVWNKNASLGVLAQGNDYYGFTVYSDRVLRDRDGQKIEQMARSAKHLNVIHIPEEYTQEAFGVYAGYLPSGSLGYICSDAIMEQAQEFFSWLMEA